MRVVEDQTLITADDDDFPDLIRVGPAYVNVPYDFVLIAEGDESDVFSAVPQHFGAHGADPVGGRVQQVVEDGDVMRREVPQRIDVVANGAHIRPAGVEIVQLAYFVPLDIFLDFRDR